MSMSSNNREPSSPLDGEGKSKADFESQFLYAVKNNHMVRAERLLKDGNFDPSKDESFIFQWACENGLEPVVRVLMKDERVDVNCKNDICIQLVCELGHVGVLNALLENNQIDPGCLNNLPVWLACQNGHLAIVQTLLQDPRVHLDSKIDEMTPVEVAVLNENYEVAQYILQQSKSKNALVRSLSKRDTNSKASSLRSRRDSTRPNPESPNSDHSPSEHPKETNDIKTIDEKLIELVSKRKHMAFHAFCAELEEILLYKVCPSNKTFNNCLRLVLKSTKDNSTERKDPSRGTDDEFISELLKFAREYPDLTMDRAVVQEYQKHYSKLGKRISMTFKNKANPANQLSSLKSSK